MKLELPYPPSLNRLFRTVLIGVCGKCRSHAHATLYKSQEYQDYVTRLKLALLEHEAESEPLVWLAKPSDVELTAHFYRPRKAGDLDNLLKALLDLLTGQLYDDDGQICALHAYRHDDKARPRVEVEVTELATNGTAKQEELFNETPKGAGHAAQPDKTGTGAAVVTPPRAVAASPEPLEQRLRRLARPAHVNHRRDE